LRNIDIDLEKETPQNAFIYIFMNSYQEISLQLEKCMKEFDLSLAKFNVLMVLKHQCNDGGLSQVEICNKLLVTAANVTKMLDRLEKEEFITKQPRDRRTNIIKITQKGSNLLDKVWIEYQKTVDNITKELTIKDLIEVNAKLMQISKGV